MTTALWSHFRGVIQEYFGDHFLNSAYSWMSLESLVLIAQLKGHPTAPQAAVSNEGTLQTLTWNSAVTGNTSTRGCTLLPEVLRPEQQG